jgi:hypothetical protein
MGKILYGIRTNIYYAKGYSHIWLKKKSAIALAI